MKRFAILILVGTVLAAVSAGAVLAVKQQKVATNPATVTFGATAIGYGNSYSVDVTNNTKRTISYQGVANDGPFTFSPGTCDDAPLVPDAICVAAVDFHPTAVGLVSGVVSGLWASDHQRYSSDVSVSGTGYVLELP